MKRILSIYVIGYLVLLMLVLGLLYTYPKLELHLMLNACHTDLQDTFFKYYSQLAEWPLYVIGLLPLIWKKKSMTIFYALSELTGGVLVQILKHLFSAPRPIVAFENYPDAVLPLVEGVSLHHSNSFPSGHTSSFFVFATCCAVILAYRYLLNARQGIRGSRLLLQLGMLGLLIFAAVGGYSRIYLSQHFLSDVCVGSIIGMTAPLLVFYFGRNKLLKLEDV